MDRARHLLVFLGIWWFWVILGSKRGSRNDPFFGRFWDPHIPVVSYIETPISGFQIILRGRTSHHMRADVHICGYASTYVDRKHVYDRSPMTKHVPMQRYYRFSPPHLKGIYRATRAYAGDTHTCTKDQASGSNIWDRTILFWTL